MYRFFLVVLLVGSLHSLAPGQVIHLILAGDTLDPNCGAGYEVIVGTLEDTFKANVRDRQLTIQKIWDRNFTRGGILDSINRVRAQPDDAIVFIANCHGASDGWFKHWLKTRNGKLYRTEIVRACVEKNSRFVAVVTDSCNKSVQLDWAEDRAEIARPDATEPLFNSLLFESHGLLDVNSATLEQFSWNSKTRGGFFLISMCRVAERQTKQRLLWEGFLKDVEKEVTTFFPFPKGGKEITGQDAITMSIPGSNGNKLPARLGLEKGNIILAVNGELVSDADGCIDAVNDSPTTMLFSVVDKKNGTIWRMSSQLGRRRGSRFGIEVSDLKEGIIGGAVVDRVSRGAAATSNRVLGRVSIK